MKIRSMIAAVLALAALPQIALAQDARLKPALDPFVRQPHPMRNPFKVEAYKNIPEHTNGEWTTTIWIKNMRTELRPLALSLNAVDADLRNYDASLNATGAELLKKSDNTTRAQMDQLRKFSKESAMRQLQAYRQVRKKQAIAGQAEASALAEVWAAMATVDADAAVVHRQEMIDEKVSLETRKKAIMEKVKKAAWVKEAFDTAKSAVSTLSSPDKLKEKLQDLVVDKVVGAIDEALMNNVLMEYADELKGIDNRLTDLEPAINKAADEIIKKRLEGAQFRLKKARIELVKARIQSTVVSVEGWDIIDDLAQMERIYKCSDVFQTLQAYNLQARSIAKSMRAHGSDYLSRLDDGAPGRAPEALMYVERDVKEVWRLNQKTTNDPQGVGGEYYGWLQQADVFRVYAEFQTNWYGDERKRVQKYMTAIVAENHLSLVESVVAQVLKTSGSTTDL